MNNKGITSLIHNGEIVQDMSDWKDMPLVGDLVGNTAPRERFFRAFDSIIPNPTEVRAGIWEASEYSEKVEDYPYNELVIVIEGSISMLDEAGSEDRFEAGDCFFIEQGFCGEWRQHGNVKIIHMTVDPKSN